MDDRLLLITIPLNVPSIILCAAGSWHFLRSGGSDAGRRTGRMLLIAGVGWLVLSLLLQAFVIHPK